MVAPLLICAGGKSWARAPAAAPASSGAGTGGAGDETTAAARERAGTTRGRRVSASSFGHQGERPHRSPARHVLELLAHPRHVHPAEPREHGDVLPALVGVG